MSALLLKPKMNEKESSKVSQKILKLGEIIPEVVFEMTEGEGGSRSTSFADPAWQGKNIILYFYPKDNTSGCTLEAEGFRDYLEKFKAKNTVILGVSKDSLKSHQNFKLKHCLSFELIRDTDQSRLCELFGVWKEKSMYGKKYFGIERSTFLINPERKLIQEWRKVSVTGHVEAVWGAI